MAGLHHAVIKTERIAGAAILAAIHSQAKSIATGAVAAATADDSKVEQERAKRATGLRNSTSIAATGRSYKISVGAAILAAIESQAKMITMGTVAPATAEDSKIAPGFAGTPAHPDFPNVLLRTPLLRLRKRKICDPDQATLHLV